MTTDVVYPFVVFGPMFRWSHIVDEGKLSGPAGISGFRSDRYLIKE